MIELIFGGVFDRFPELNVFFAEVDFGWVPYVEGADRQQLPAPRSGQPVRSAELPSEYIGKHFRFGYMTDTFGLRQPRGTWAPERVLWSSDYPHISADWPHVVASHPVLDGRHQPRPTAS